MTTEVYGVARSLYLLALTSAKSGDLSAAVRFASAALAMYKVTTVPETSDASTEPEAYETAAKARRLLGICLFELGDTVAAANILVDFPDLADDAQMVGKNTAAGLCEVGHYMRQGKWRVALKKAEAISHQSVRTLSIRGCILAGEKHYAAAGRLFAQAAQKDKGGRASSEYLAEAVKCAGPFWQRFGVVKWI